MTFSENVTGVDASDFALSSGSTGGGGGGGNTGSGQSVQTRSPALAISYNQTVTDTISVAASGTAASISVAVDITHQYIVDLKIDLIAPDGTVQTLHNRESDTADIDQTYQPDFGSASIAGDWILRIHDNFSADDGVLNSWTLTIDYGATPALSLRSQALAARTMRQSLHLLTGHTTLILSHQATTSKMRQRIL